MRYDFGEFIQKSKISCKTKLDFISMINEEKTSVSANIDGENNIKRDIYSKRLDNAKFCVQTRAMKEKDKYNDDLRCLLDGLR